LSEPLTNLPPAVIETSAWKGLERLLPDLIKRTGIKTDLAIEFGVWHGFSAAALANNFNLVIGVDTFVGDLLAGTSGPMMYTTAETLKPWENIQLVQTGFQDFWRDGFFSDIEPDLIHIDIVHTYEDTFACGAIALAHCDLVIFHDTESFPEVKRALCDLCQIFKVPFRNFYQCHGLGILTRKDLK
jgi:hypothetical protein